MISFDLLLLILLGCLGFVLKIVEGILQINSSSQNQENFCESQEMSVDSAWESKRYAYVLSLLQNDSDFPEKFNLEELNEEDDIQRHLKNLAQERNQLHEWIKNDEIQKVKDFTLNTKSKYYLNDKNYSAAFTALKFKKFKIYAYLQAKTKSYNQELGEFNNLTDIEKNELGDIMFSNFSESPNSHLLHIISQSKINDSNSFEHSTEKIKGYLDKLDQIEGVSIILKVIKYVENLSVVLDFNNNSLEIVCPGLSNADKGTTLSSQGKIYIAAGRARTENMILGTMVHEFTHMAMELVFKNNCNPYFKWDDAAKKEFRKIACFIYDNISEIKDTPSETLTDAFACCYNDKGQVFSELVARVPHIIVQFPGGEEWLEKNVPDLLEFYKNKVMPQCEKLIQESYLLRPKSLNRYINESVGEIILIKKCNLSFKNVHKLENFFECHENKIFVLVTEYTWFGLLRALQAIYGADYIEFYDRFLALKLENFENNYENVWLVFNSEATETLFIECPLTMHFSNQTLKGIKKVIEIVKTKMNKKIIFITKEKEKENQKFIKILKDYELDKSFSETTDEDFSLCDLDEGSRINILHSAILFQGEEISLGGLIKNDENLLKCVNAEMVQDLLDNKKIEIGSKPYDTSNLEGAYADAVSEVNLDTLIYEMKNSNDIFVISGENMPNRIMEFYKSWNERFDTSLLGKMENLKFKKVSNEKRMFRTNKEVTDNDFKKFCSYNSTKKIYLLEMKEKFTFELRKVYNPDFYIKRKFNQVTFEKDLLTKNQPDNLKQTFVIVIVEDNSNNNSKFPIVTLVDLEKKDIEFERLSKLEESVHLLKYEHNELLWIKSCGSLSGLREWIDLDNKKIIDNETELIKKIKNEKLVILADDPGMGKSTTITKLYEFENVLAIYWVIRINLKDHMESIREISENIDTKQVKKFLLAIDSKLKNDFSKNLLDAALDMNKNFGKDLLLCFDGFDELLEKEDRKIIINLLKFLKNSSPSKIWITTRFHFKKILEDELQVFSITFEPIDDSSKIDFIANYMENRLKLSLTKTKFDEVFEGDSKVKENSALLDYAKMFLDKVKSIFKKDLERFIGTPLQLHLLLENSVESFLNWIENSVKPDFSYLGKDLVEVYKNYFNAKYEVYFKKKKILEEETKSVMKENSEKCHEKIANSLFFEVPTTEILKYKFSLLLLGITKAEFEKIEFVHLTFQEYFLAQYFLNNFKNEGSQKLMQRLCELFIKKILVDEKYVLVRHFIDIHLSNNKSKNIFKKNDEEFLTVFKSLGPNMIFRFAIIERNENILDFLLNLSFTEHDYRMLLEDQWGGELLLNLATREKNNFALKRIVEVASNYNLIESCLPKKNTLGHTALYLAIRYKNDFALNLIIETAKRFKILDKVFKNVDSFKATAIHFAVLHANDFALNEALKTVHLLPELLNIVAEEKGTVFNVAVTYKNDEALAKIIELASESDLEQLKKFITIRDRHKNTPLHSAVKKKNKFAFNQIINIASELKLKREILSVANDYKITLFHIAVKNKNDWALKRLIKITPNEILVPLLLHAFTEYEDTAMHYADEYDDLSILQKSFEGTRKYHLPEDLVRTFASYKETAFHIAVRIKNDFAADQIMELASKNNLVQQLLNSVAVYEGTEFSLSLDCGNKFTLKQVKEKPEKEQFHISKCEDTPFSLAIKSKNEYALTKMMELASNHNLNQLILNIADNNTTLHLAIKYGNFFAMNKISSVLDVNQQYKLLSMADADGKSVLELAALAEDQRFFDLVADIFLKFSADKIFELLSFVNRNNEAILHLVFERKKYYSFSRIIELLSKLSFDQQYGILTSRNKFRQTIFHLAVDSKNENIVNQIVEIVNKFSFEQQTQFLEMEDEEGNTVLDIASFGKIILLLIKFLRLIQNLVQINAFNSF